jgi:hypothetical protein
MSAWRPHAVRMALALCLGAVGSAAWAQEGPDPPAEPADDEAPAPDDTADEAPPEEAPADETPPEQPSPAEAPPDQAPADETPPEQAPQDEAPPDEAPADPAIPEDRTEVVMDELGAACGLSVGMAGNVAPPGRGWDLSSPRGAWSLSPAVGLHCGWVGEGVARGFWLGAEAVPTLQHSYRRLGVRTSLLGVWLLGFDIPLSKGWHAGPLFAANGAAWGMGGRVRMLPVPRPGLGIRGVEARFTFMNGQNPHFQASLMVHVQHAWVGAAAPYEGPTDVPPSIGPLREWDLRVGFDLGLLMGLRLELQPGRSARLPQLALRAGLLSSLPNDTLVQPTLLAGVEAPLGGPILQLTGSLGGARRNAVWVPVVMGGLQAEIPDSVVHLHAGVLLGGPSGTPDDQALWTALDISIGWAW